jgi:hypothetical protein
VTVLGVTGYVTFGPPGIDVDIAGAGRFRLVVSRRPINRFARNDFKRFAEVRTAREIAALLASHSAGPPTPPRPPAEPDPRADPSEPSQPLPPRGFADPG